MKRCSMLDLEVSASRLGDECCVGLNLAGWMVMVLLAADGGEHECSAPGVA